MTKQEEIREVLNTLCCVASAKDLSKSSTGFDEEVKGAMVELDELGVVIKGERELPAIPEFLYDKEEYRPYLKRGAINYSKMLTGYVAVEPLIEESK